MAHRATLPVSIGCSNAWLSPDNIGGWHGGVIHSEGVGMAWVLLVLAIVAEVVGTLSLKASEGFSRLWPSVAVVVGYAVAFTLLAFALKTLDVGPAYALWAGLGTVGAAVGGWLIFSESLSTLTVIGITTVVVGVVAITLGETQT